MRGMIGVLGGCLVVAAAAPGVVVSGAGDAVAAKKRTAVQLKVASTSQRKILAKRRVAVRVRSRRAGTFRLFASSRRRPRKGNPRVVITRAREVRLAARRTRTVRLKLIRSGRREISGCTGRRLIANALRLRGEDRRPGRTMRRARALRTNAARCGSREGPNSTPPKRDPIAYETENAARCDDIDRAACLFPFPNDHFTARDSTTDTGRRLNLKGPSMPANRAGKGITPGPYNRNDGLMPQEVSVLRPRSSQWRRRRRWHTTSWRRSRADRRGRSRTARAA